MKKVIFILTVMVLIYGVGVAAPEAISANAEDTNGHGNKEVTYPPQEAGNGHKDYEEAQAQPGEVPPGIEGTDTPGDGQHKGWTRGIHNGWDKDKMQKLKQEDPDRFQELAGRRREEIEKRLAALKEEDPERYEQLRSRIDERRRMNMENLKKNDPMKYRQTVTRRKEMVQERLKYIKKEDPERYKKISEGMREIKEFQHLRREDPQKAVEYLSDHPRLKDRVEDFGDRHEDRYDKWKDRRDRRDHRKDLRDKRKDRYDRRGDRYDRREDRRDKREYRQDGDQGGEGRQHGPDVPMNNVGPDDKGDEGGAGKPGKPGAPGQDLGPGPSRHSGPEGPVYRRRPDGPGGQGDCGRKIGPGAGNAGRGHERS